MRALIFKWSCWDACKGADARFKIQVLIGNQASIVHNIYNESFDNFVIFIGFESETKALHGADDTRGSAAAGGARPEAERDCAQTFRR